MKILLIVLSLYLFLSNFCLANKSVGTIIEDNYNPDEYYTCSLKERFDYFNEDGTTPSKYDVWEISQFGWSKRDVPDLFRIIINYMLRSELYPMTYKYLDEYNNKCMLLTIHFDGPTKDVSTKQKFANGLIKRLTKMQFDSNRIKAKDMCKYGPGRRDYPLNFGHLQLLIIVIHDSQS